MIEHDSYYKDQSHLTFEERVKTNYDHPFAFDTDLMIEQIKELLAGRPVDIPTYDYTAHTRSSKTYRQEPQDVFIVEGILVLEDKRLRDLMDIKIFVDTMMMCVLFAVSSVIWRSVAEALIALLTNIWVWSNPCTISLSSRPNDMLISSFLKVSAIQLLSTF